MIQYTNRSSLTIQVPRLVPGLGSIVRLIALTENTDSLDLKGIFDQGSDQVTISGNKTVDTTESSLLEPLGFLLNPILAAYYGFFSSLTIFGIFVYFRRRNKIKSIPKKIAFDIMKIRKVLRNDLMSTNKFSLALLSMSDKERLGSSMDDYLLLDDFYQELENRKSYLEIGLTTKESDLSRANTLRKLNEALLASAENALNKVDWNKYR